MLPDSSAKSLCLTAKAPPGQEKRLLRPAGRIVFYKGCLLCKAAQYALGGGYIGIGQRIVGGHDIADGL